MQYEINKLDIAKDLIIALANTRVFDTGSTEQENAAIALKRVMKAATSKGLRPAICMQANENIEDCIDCILNKTPKAECVRISARHPCPDVGWNDVDS